MFGGMSDRSPLAPCVAVVEDDPAIRALLVAWLDREGYATHVFGSGEAFVEELGRLLPDVIVLDLGLPGISGFAVLDRCKAAHPYVPVVMLTGEERVESIVRAMRQGASDYLLKPVTSTRFLTTIRNAVRQNELIQRVRDLEAHDSGAGFRDIIGASAAMLHFFAQSRQVAATDVSVLIYGESGTGKELVARALHQTGLRADGPFVAIDCAAVPETLQESELFGHERGAFTGATQRKSGRFEEADGGTLFLDEVGELSAALQAKLLRVLQEKTFRRVGGTADIASDFRLVAATNRDLGEAVSGGLFREDLYYRIAVFRLALPPLRERGTDLLLIAHALARTLGVQLRGEPYEIPPETESVLLGHDWPGNVRELQNALQRAIVMSPDRRLLPAVFADLTPARTETPELSARAQAPLTGGSSGVLPLPEGGALENLIVGLTLDEIEGRVIRASMRRHDGNRTRAAEELGISRTTLYRKLGPG